MTAAPSGWNPGDPRWHPPVDDQAVGHQAPGGVPVGQPADAGPPTSPAPGYPYSAAPYPTYPASGPPAAVQQPVYPPQEPVYPPQEPAYQQYPGYPASAPPLPAQQSAYPMPQALPAMDPVLVQIADVRVTATMVYTPVGEMPLVGSTWTSQDRWTSSQRTPTWAVVCAIVGFFCLTIFSLLFLLAKETVYTGVVTVFVSGRGLQYQAHVPIADPNHALHVHQQVDYVRALAPQRTG